MTDRFERRAERREARAQRFQRSWSGNGRVWTGIFLLLIGGVALLKAMLLPIPEWVFTWQMLLIVIGVFSGIRSNFSGGFWFVLIIVGSVFLLNEFFPGLIVKSYMWPLALIVLGLFFIFRPRRRNWQWREYGDKDSGTQTMGSESNFIGTSTNTSDLDFVDSTSIFGGTKKNIVSKDFRGGDIVNIFGGCEIDLTQADIQGTVKLELTQMFGGTKLIVPAHWVVKPEMAVFFGGVEDKRRMPQKETDPGKVLVLHGTSIFAGIEIKSY